MKLKNSYTSKKILIQTDCRNVMSFDFFTTGFLLNKIGYQQVLNYFKQLPLEAFKASNINSINLFSFGKIYCFIKLNKNYLKENYQIIIDDLKEIFENEKNISPYNYGDEVDTHKYFKDDLKEISLKYEYWANKKKEDKGYNRYKILERDTFKCRICGRGYPEVTLHIDHWIPKARGGLDIYSNLITLCSQCNISKNAQIPKYPIEYILNKKEVDGGKSKQ